MEMACSINCTLQHCDTPTNVGSTFFLFSFPSFSFDIATSTVVPFRF
jgi:hypothetical protein